MATQRDKPCLESSLRSKIRRCYSQLSVSKTRILLIKTKSVVPNFHGQAMQTKIKPSKPKVQNPKQHFLEHLLSCTSIDQHKDTGVMRQLTKTAIFITTSMKKHMQQFILPNVIFCQFVGGNVLGLMPKLFSVCRRYKPGFYFFLLYKIK